MPTAIEVGMRIFNASKCFFLSVGVIVMESMEINPQSYFRFWIHIRNQSGFEKKKKKDYGLMKGIMDSQKSCVQKIL